MSTNPPSLIVVDDFLANPDVARAAALALRYDPAAKDGNYPGLLSDRPLPVAGLEAQVSALAGMEVVAAPGTIHGHCRLTLRGDRGITGVHIDPCAYSGILYLSRDEHCAGGTDFYRHKRTGLERVPRRVEAIRAAGFADVNELVAAVVNADTGKPSRWERVMRVPMRYNRLILFDPWTFHDAAPAFGSDAETGRLVMLMFFARVAATGL